MILLSTIRILKFAAQDFLRNFWLSLVTVTILVLSLFSINFIVVVGVISQTAITAVEDKIDLSLYLVPDAGEDGIAALKGELERLDGVKSVGYISKSQALEAFQAKHQDNQSIQDALREVGNNPLSASLIIEANQINDYTKIIDSLGNLSNHAIIESQNFDDHKTLLATMNTITERTRQVGILVSLIFVAITVLVVFNAVRIAIYTHQKEIRVMKLVGASNWFIRAPFLVEAIFYALAGTLIIIGIFYPFLQLLQPYLGTFFNADSLNIISYFNHNFVAIFGLEFIAATFINVFASLIAVGKYMKV
jgi:cell division transport system permease protein